MAYLTEITTEHGTYTGQTIHSIIRREYGHNASFLPSASPNDPYKGQVVSRGGGGFIVEATVRDWTPGDYEIQQRGYGEQADIEETQRMTGSQLRGIREAFNLSGANLAKRLGVREDTLHKWEKDRDPIPYAVPGELQSVGRDLIGEIEGAIADLEDVG